MGSLSLRALQHDYRADPAGRVMETVRPRDPMRLSLPSPHSPPGLPMRSGAVCQIVRAYSAIVRSVENLPLLAMLYRAIFAHWSAFCKKIK